MADVTEAVKSVTDDEQQVETTADGEKIEGTAAPKIDTEEVKGNGGAAKEEDTQETKDTIDDTKEDAASDSKSSGHKRKEEPASISAHDRNERKRGRGGSRYNANITSRFDDQPESNDADDIRRQVEFYFSDSNLPIDAYLLSSTGGHRNRPVELKVIHNFKRMRHFQPYSAVRDAVKASDFLDLNDDDEITRKIPLDEKFTDDPMHNRTLVHTSSMPRSIYAKGFGDETKSTHLDIEAFFAPYGPINSVRLRRHGDGAFKGSVFVEFEGEEAQQRFLELDPKPQWEAKELEIMSKQEYVDIKHQGIMDGVVKPRSPKDFGHNKWRGKDRRYDDRDRRGSKGYDNRDRRGSKDKFDQDDWKGRRDRDQREDRRGGHRGRGRGGRGDRGGGRGGRRASPDDIDKKRRRSDEDEEDREEEDRIKVKAMKVKTDEDAGEDGGETSARAEEINAEAKTNGNAAERAAEETEKLIGESKKRALEDEGEAQGEAKKVEADEES